MQLISREQRQQRLQQSGCTLLLTGLMGAGKTTIAYTLEKLLFSVGALAYVLDGDNVRHGLNCDLDYEHSARSENVRRTGEVAKLFADAGLITIASLIAPYCNDRQALRESHQQVQLPFFEIFIDTPLAVCEQRDPKGLYERAHAGKLQHVTGIDAPYQRPEHPDLRLETTTMTASEDAQAILTLLYDTHILSKARVR